MYDEIRRRGEELRRASARTLVQRVVSGPDEQDDARSRISYLVADQAERRLREYGDVRHGPVELDARWTAEAVRSHLHARLQQEMSGPVLYDLPIILPFPLWNQIITPPYDQEWAEGAGIALGAVNDGKVVTLPLENGFSAAGIGFNISNAEAATATVTPGGTYTFNLFSLAALPTAKSRGGMGIAVYRDAERQPTATREAELWNVAGVPAYFGQQGSGRIADASSPPGSFGTVPLAPVMFNLAAGSNYLIWVWCWQVAHLPPNSGLWAMLSSVMPYVTVSLDDPFAGPL